MNAGIRFVLKSFEFVSQRKFMQLSSAPIKKGEGSFRIFWYCWELLVLADMRRYRHVIINPTEGQIIWLFFFDKLNKWCNYLALETFTSANQNFENGEIWWNTYGEGE